MDVLRDGLMAWTWRWFGSFGLLFLTWNVLWWSSRVQVEFFRQNLLHRRSRFTIPSKFDGKSQELLAGRWVETNHYKPLSIGYLMFILTIITSFTSTTSMSLSKLINRFLGLSWFTNRLISQKLRFSWLLLPQQSGRSSLCLSPRTFPDYDCPALKRPVMRCIINIEL